MIVYHGSNHNFKTLKISKSLVRYNSTLENEGMGIYFSTDKEIARGYGKYIYTLEVNDKCFIDLRNKHNCVKYIDRLRKFVYAESNIDIGRYMDLSITVNYLYSGGISIYNLSREIWMNLDSSELWYKLSQTRRNRVYTLLKRFDKANAKVYMFNYTIKNIGVIKDVNENIVRIISKENSY